MNRRWRILPPAPKGQLEEMSGFAPLAAQLLYNRGITELSQAHVFLGADASLEDCPRLLPDVDKAIARIHQALLSNERIAIYGDFDADGVCGTAVLTEGLSFLGGKVVPYIPHRLKEDRGLSTAALEELSQQGITLIITVDCGITALREVEQARKMGLDVIVTDHHNTLPDLPDALAVVNPKRRDSVYPFPLLAGTGVAYKLLQALLQSLGREEYLEELLDLVVMGTIPDMVPLVGENRYLVSRGLQALNETKRIGLRELVRIAGLQLGKLDEENVSWSLGPRLNAAGRVDWALTSYELLVTDSSEEAIILAQKLEQRNAERQRLTEEVLVDIRTKLSPAMLDLPFLMVGNEGYPEGVIGLVAGRLTEEFYRPTVVFSFADDVVHGSARSIPEFDMVSAFEECQDLMLRFGGHPRAAGFAAAMDNLSSLQQRLLRIAERQLAGLDLNPTLTIDAELPLSAVDEEVFQLVGEFAPFGQENPAPVFVGQGVSVLDCRAVGQNQDHLRFKLRHGNVVWDGISFNLGARLGEVTPGIDVVYSLKVDHWGGQDLLQLSILDFAPLG